MSDVRKLNSTILREYDIRGIVGEKFDVNDARSIGRGFGSIVRERVKKNLSPMVVVGYDGRLSSADFAVAICEGLMASGVDVTDIGCGPTPMLYFGTYKLSGDGGMMITGSHNPPEYNGVKMMLSGKPFYGKDIQNLGRRIGTGNFTEGLGQLKRHTLNSAYVGRLLDDFDGHNTLTVAWDPGNGSSGEVVQELIARLPGKHLLINEKIDGKFPAHHPDPTVEKNLSQLKDLVIDNNCDLGIGFDGDGDRIGVIDSKGRVLWGDQILIILAREVLREFPGKPIIADVKASKVFFDEIRSAGGKPIMSPAGHSLIKTRMLELNSPLAGEMSGHIFFADKYFGYDDALYAAIRLLTILGQSDQSLAEIYDNLPQMINTPELRFDCPDERKFHVIEEIKGRLNEIRGINVQDIDGVRVETENGWWLLRASNTQAVLVARCEAANEESLSILKNQVRRQLAASNIDIPLDFR